MTEQEVFDFVSRTFDDDLPDKDKLQDAFVSTFGRSPNEDEVADMWSYLCSVVTHCPCVTRREHENGACQ